MQPSNAVCPKVWLAFKQGSNLLSFYKVDYVCWQELKYSLGVSRATCARTHTHTHADPRINDKPTRAHLRTMDLTICSFWGNKFVMLFLAAQLTSLNLFQDRSLLYWATVPGHFSWLIAWTTVSVLSKRATAGSRKKSIFCKQREKGGWQGKAHAEVAAKCRLWREKSDKALQKIKKCYREAHGEFHMQ